MDFRAVVGAVVAPGVDLLEEEEPSCLVGDLFGDLNQSAQTFEAIRSLQRVLAPNLDTGPDLATGVGLPAFMLCLFVAVESRTLCLLVPPTAIIGGLPFVVAPFALPFGRGTGVGVDSSTTLATEGLTNIPWPSGHSKYRCPCTAPSFLPEASSSSIPIQSPGAKRVLPTNCTVALTPFESSTVCPSWKSESSGIVPQNHGSMYPNVSFINSSALWASYVIDFIVWLILFRA